MQLITKYRTRVVIMQAACRLDKIAVRRFFLPRDATLTRYLPQSCVCLSVCLSQVGILYWNG